MTPSSTSRRRPWHARPGCLLLLWAVLLLAAAAGQAAWQYRTLLSGLDKESGLLLRLVAQRASQHDAHLTALSAIAAAGHDGNDALFREVAASIMHFYPRIDEIRLVALGTAAPGVSLGPPDAALDERVRSTASASGGEITLLAHPRSAQHYLMIKRSPNTDEARYGLMLGIDAVRLLQGAGEFWLAPGALMRLSLPDGRALTGGQIAEQAFQFRRPLGSASQPLLLETGLVIGWRDLFAPGATALLFLAVSLLYLAAIAAWRQRARTRAAEAQARLSALESRQAHASRVNAMGEMASGLMHELTQPLTAILAQGQASVRLAAQGRSDALAPVLESTVSQARRAAAILERFRNWSRPQQGKVSVFDVRAALGNVQALLAPQAAACGVRLDFFLPGAAVRVRADPVEMEQLLFNLVRNGIEAAQEGAGDGCVTVSLREEDGRVLMEVADNGPGIGPDMRDRLFTPFATTREQGMGLGLALSKRLAERMQGDLMLMRDGPGATFRVDIPGAGQTEDVRQ